MQLPYLGCAGGERRYCSREESGGWRKRTEDKEKRRYYGDFSGSFLNKRSGCRWLPARPFT
jgi:hypothetical protein